MNYLIFILYIICVLSFFVMGLTLWLDREFILSILFYVTSFVFLLFFIKRIKRKNVVSKEQNINVNNDFINIKVQSYCRTVEVSDEELQQMKEENENKTDFILFTQNGYKYSDIKFLNYKGKEIYITYKEEFDLCSSMLLHLFDLYLKLKDTKDIYIIEREHRNYKLYYERFLRIKNRKDFLEIYRSTKKDYREMVNSTFPMILSKAVNNPSLFNIDFTALCIEAVKYYRQYWINVLSNYKRKKTFDNRKLYLLNTLPTILSYKCLSNNPSAQNVLISFTEEIKSMSYKE